MHIKLGLKLREVKGSLCNSKLQARLYILNTIEQETRTQHSELGVDNLVSQLILLSELKTSNSSHLYTNSEHVCLKWSTKPEFEFRVGSPYNDVVSIRRKNICLWHFIIHSSRSWFQGWSVKKMASHRAIKQRPNEIYTYDEMLIKTKLTISHVHDA